MGTMNLWRELDQCYSDDDSDWDDERLPLESEQTPITHGQMLCIMQGNRCEEDFPAAEPTTPFPEDIASSSQCYARMIHLLPQQNQGVDDAFLEEAPLDVGNVISKGTLRAMMGLTPQALDNKIPPNIQEGIGSNSNNKNIVDLADFFASEVTLMVYESTLYRYNGIFGENLSERDCHVMLIECAEKHGIDGTLVPTIYKSIQWLIERDPSIQRKESFPDQHHLLNFQDGTFNLETMELLPHNPDDLLFHCLDLNFYDLNFAEGPVFERFIDCASAGNPAVRQQVLELIAIALTGLETKSFFAAIGPSNSGKSQLGRLILELVGGNRMMTIRGMDDFGRQFSLGDIAGKRVILCMDLPDSTLPPKAVGMLKQLVGDDTICVEQKYKNPITVHKKPVFFCAGNHPIRISNMANDDALLNRMVIIPFLGVPSQEEQVPQLYSALYEERLYIIREAIDAYHGLVAQGNRPTLAEVPVEYASRDARDEMATVLSFLETRCVVETGAEVTTQELYSDFLNYCSEEGEAPLESLPFSKLFAEAIRGQTSTVTQEKRVAKGGRGYRGIRLVQEGEATYSV